MSRSEYDDDCWGWSLIMWRGAVASAIRGKRGQAFILEMWKAMTSLPEPRLIAEDLEKDGAVCAIGSVLKARGIDASKFDPECTGEIAKALGISSALAREIVFENDEGSYCETPEARFRRMKKWAEDNLLPVPL